MRPPMDTIRALPLVGVLVLAAGCSIDVPAVQLNDSLRFDISLTEDTLSSPYALGTSMTMNVAVHDVRRHRYADWTLVADDPTVLEVVLDNVDDNGLNYTVTTLEAGTTTLRVLDENGDELHQAEVRVLRPDRVALTSNLTFRTGVVADDDDGFPNVVVGARAAFAVTYMEADHPLAGVGIIGVADPVALAVDTDRSDFLSAHDWIVVTPDALGDASVALDAAGAPLGEVHFSGVAETDVTLLQLVDIGQDEPTEGEQRTLAAVATTENGAAVLGISPAWMFGASELDDSGELLTYTYDPDTCGSASATVAGLTASRTICASDISAVDLGQVGCSTAGDRTGPGVAGWGVALVAIAAALRRTR